MSIVTGFAREKRKKGLLIELSCMSFSAVCYLASGIIGINRQFLLESILMMGLAVLCAGRVGYLLHSVYRSK